MKATQPGRRYGRALNDKALLQRVCRLHRKALRQQSGSRNQERTVQHLARLIEIMAQRGLSLKVKIRETGQWTEWAPMRYGQQN